MTPTLTLLQKGLHGLESESIFSTVQVAGVQYFF